jgi:hypothetical protein
MMAKILPDGFTEMERFTKDLNELYHRAKVGGLRKGVLTLTFDDGMNYQLYLNDIEIEIHAKAPVMAIGDENYQISLSSSIMSPDKISYTYPTPYGYPASFEHPVPLAHPKAELDDLEKDSSIVGHSFEEAMRSLINVDSFIDKDDGESLHGVDAAKSLLEHAESLKEDFYKYIEDDEPVVWKMVPHWKGIIHTDDNDLGITYTAST